MILANIASMMLFTLLPVYLAELGATVGQIGMVFSLAALVPLSLQIIGGWLSDSIGRLRTIALGSLGATLGYFVLVLAPTWQWVLLGLCLEYISGSLVGPSFGAFIAEQSTEENRGRVFGISGGIFMVVGVIGPSLGGFLAYRFGFRLMLLVTAILYATASGLRVWMARAARFAPASRTEHLTWGSLRIHLAGMLSMLTAGGLVTWIWITDGVRDVAFKMTGELEPLYLSQIGGMSVEQIGWLSSVLGVAIMLTTLPAGWLSDKWGERVTIMLGFLLQFVGFVIFLNAKDFAGFATSSVVFGIGVGIMAPAYNSLISKAVPENMRGIAFGLLQTSLGVISLPAPWIGAQLWERISPRLPFWISALAALITVIPVGFKFVLPSSAEAAPTTQE